jgi:hypothetical protein
LSAEFRTAQGFSVGAEVADFLEELFVGAPFVLQLAGGAKREQVGLQL